MFAALRKERKFDNIPILIYSTSLNKADIDKAYHMGLITLLLNPMQLTILPILSKDYFNGQREVTGSATKG